MRGLAYAKINLTLEISGKRPDGYHELVSVMQTISLADSLAVAPGQDLRLECDVPELAGDDNLVLKAARLLGAAGHFRLEKRIPMAGGLGGGSSDGALALRLLDAERHLHLPPEQLLDAAARLGSDVPFFMYGGTALVGGRGERVMPLPDLPPRWLVLLNPGVPLSTAAVYGELRPDEFAAEPRSRYWTGQDVPQLVNSLEAPALRLEPAIATCQERLREAGLSQVLLSGSGPTVFGLASDESEARRVADATGGLAARFVGRDQALRIEPPSP
jgi:4-diphosphocytidyl-2-C-methyl-D-erythritol kinase